MANGGSKKSRERTHTDESLQSERRDLDAAVANRLATAEVDADDIVDHARALADAIVRKTRLNEDERHLRPAAEGGPLVAAFDYERMLQVLANLITNAIKFTPPGGTIHVSARPLGESVHLSVRDTGVGIPAHLTEAIFERFRQVAGHDRGGLGLGLYISKCLVDAQCGRMWAESQAGEGTTLHVSLPVIDERRKADSASGGASATDHA